MKAYVTKNKCYQYELLSVRVDRERGLAAAGGNFLALTCPIKWIRTLLRVKISGRIKHQHQLVP